MTDFRLVEELRQAEFCEELHDLRQEVTDLQKVFVFDREKDLLEKPEFQLDSIIEHRNGDFRIKIARGLVV